MRHSQNGQLSCRGVDAVVDGMTLGLRIETSAIVLSRHVKIDERRLGIGQERNLGICEQMRCIDLLCT